METNVEEFTLRQARNSEALLYETVYQLNIQSNVLKEKEKKKLTWSITTDAASSSASLSGIFYLRFDT